MPPVIIRVSPWHPPYVAFVRIVANTVPDLRVDGKCGHTVDAVSGCRAGLAATSGTRGRPAACVGWLPATSGWTDIGGRAEAANVRRDPISFIQFFKTQDWCICLSRPLSTRRPAEYFLEFTPGPDSTC